ncbi:MAG: dTDP-4-dehydrorhamnose 3,5-epimerase [Cyanobium sp. CZS 48M]|nr:dTDP-4-dehydrorhamnose 3,5-epimerase [Cyanobium sp. CZS48M]
MVDPQGKLVRCSQGSVFDVAVDVRRGSPSFTHGFLVLSAVADFCYLCSDYYHPASEQGIAWDDPAMGISWPQLPAGVTVQLSTKDRSNPSLQLQDPSLLPASF